MSVKSDFCCATVMLVALSCFHPSHAAGLYKWLDEDGHAHYSDTIPPRDIRQKHEQFNKQGVVVKTIDEPKTEQELAAQLRQRKKERRKKIATRKQAIHDRILLESFGGVEEIIAARDRQIATLESSITITRTSIETLKKNVQELMKKAAHYERRGEGVPQTLLSNIEQLKLRIDRHRSFIRRKRREQARLRKEYEADVKRYLTMNAHDEESNSDIPPEAPHREAVSDR